MQKLQLFDLLSQPILQQSSQILYSHRAVQIVDMILFVFPFSEQLVCQRSYCPIQLVAEQSLIELVWLPDSHRPYHCSNQSFLRWILMESENRSRDLPPFCSELEWAHLHLNHLAFFLGFGFVLVS